MTLPARRSRNIQVSYLTRREGEAADRIASDLVSAIARAEKAEDERDAVEAELKSARLIILRARAWGDSDRADLRRLGLILSGYTV
jgi:hypothetical protein